MKIRVEVELYTGSGRKSVDVIFTEDDLRAFAEEQAQKDYDCNSCTGKAVEVVFRAD